MACLIPDDSFSSFKKEKLVRIAELYHSDFSEIERVFLESELDTYIHDMKSSIQFIGLKGIGSLAKKLVETKKNFVYPLIVEYDTPERLISRVGAFLKMVQSTGAANAQYLQDIVLDGEGRTEE
ncbi:hypothetical protein LXL04_034449 [Taraxacum kok-saghyz]